MMAGLLPFPGVRTDPRIGAVKGMKRVEPIVIKIGETIVNPDAMRAVLETSGVTKEAQDRFLAKHGRDAQALIEFAGRICY